jgi:hypothetical protein
MAIRHLTYLDLNAQQRQEHAKAYRAQLRQMLASPFLTPDQTKVLTDRLALISKWEKGSLGIGEAPKMPLLPAPAQDD